MKKNLIEHECSVVDFAHKAEGAAIYGQVNNGNKVKAIGIYYSCWESYE